MARPAPYRLDPVSYPVHDTVRTRFQDLGSMGHLNNVAFAALFEDARVRFNWALGRMNRQDGFRAVVAANTVTYLAEGRYPDDVAISTGVARIGNRSWEIHALMMQRDRPIATAETLIAMTDPKTGGIPDDYRAALTTRLMLATE